MYLSVLLITIGIFIFFLLIWSEFKEIKNKRLEPQDFKAKENKNSRLLTFASIYVRFDDSSEIYVYKRRPWWVTLYIGDRVLVVFDGVDKWATIIDKPSSEEKAIFVNKILTPLELVRELDSDKKIYDEKFVDIVIENNSEVYSYIAPKKYPLFYNEKIIVMFNGELVNALVVRSPYLKTINVNDIYEELDLYEMCVNVKFKKNNKTVTYIPSKGVSLKKGDIYSTSAGDVTIVREPYGPIKQPYKYYSLLTFLEKIGEEIETEVEREKSLIQVYETYVDVMFDNNPVVLTFIAPKDVNLTKGDRVLIKNIYSYEYVTIVKEPYKILKKYDMVYTKLNVFDR